MKRIAATVLLALFAVLAGSLAARAQESNQAADPPDVSQYYDRVVEKLVYDIPFYLDADTIKKVSKIKAGRKFSRWRLRQTLRNFHLLGEVDNTTFLAEPEGSEKVNVTVKIYPRYILRDIRVVNNYSYNVSEILNDILRIEPGDDFRDEDIDVYRQKLKDALARKGHLKAEIKFDVVKTKREEDNKVDLRIKFNERPTFKIVRFDFSEAELGLHSRSEILKIAKWKDGMDYREDKILDGLARLRKWLRANGYLEARVPDLDLNDPTAFHIEEEKSDIIAMFPLKVGPRVDIFYDNECFTCAEMKWKFTDVLGLDNQRRFNKWIAKDFAKRIRLYFQRQGYYLADVKYEYREYTEPGGQPVKAINLTAEKGPSVSIRSIDFKENRKFEDKKLLELLKNKSTYVEEDFDKDLENVLNFYNSNGFLKAKIAQKEVTYDERKEKIDIVVVIEEGPRTILRELNLEGAKAIAPHKLKKLIAQLPETLKVDEPFNPFLVQQIKTQMLAEYFRQGYAKARVKENVEISEDNTGAVLTFTFTEGIRYHFGNLYLRGNKLTKKHIVMREIVVREGDKYNFEKIFRSEQALVQLGFFNSVDISPVNPDLDESIVDMVITVDERKSGYITGGLGYNTFTGYNTAIEIGHRNLAGYGRRISYRFEANVKDPSFQFDQRKNIVTFTWPWIARVPLDGTLTVTDMDAAQIAYDVRSFSVRIGTTLVWKKMLNFLEATHPDEKVRDLAANNHGFADPFTMRFDWELAKDFIYNVDPAVPDQEQGEVQLSTLSPMLIHDLRDNVFNPTRWTYNTIRFDYGPPWFLSQVDYLKVTGTTSWYLPIFAVMPFLPGWVFAENVVVGHLQTLRPTDTVPISRRFFLGGSTTLRGFGQNQISPVGDDGKTPVGGYFMAYQNTELRIPLPYSLGILAFFDAGDVTGGTNNYDLMKVRTTSGLGFEYLTPIGPISAIYGVKLNRQTDESMGEFYISIGNAF
ncbi:MAG: outer membrane protein assembly factor BamA [Myxococcales bacterium]|nr:outer membrane protein assembly factor BamA [Myxococcales bacterium]